MLGHARRARVEGRVRIGARISENGKVDVLCIQSSLPIFEAAAVDSVEKWSYKPATLDGKPQGVLMSLVVDFRLE